MPPYRAADHSQVRTGNNPQIMAALRNRAITAAASLATTTSPPRYHTPEILAGHWPLTASHNRLAWTLGAPCIRLATRRALRQSGERQESLRGSGVLAWERGS